MSSFENDLVSKFQEKGISASSIKLYINNLRKLNDGELNGFKFLEKPEKIVEKLTNQLFDFFRERC